MERIPFECEREGLTIRGYEYRPEGKMLAAVIVAPGFIANMTRYFHYAEDFAAHGYDTFIFDFNGGGLGCISDGRTEDQSVLTEVRDLKAVVEYVRGQKQTDSGKIILMGCSQGGFVAALTAGEMPDKIWKQVLFYPGFGIPDCARAGQMRFAVFDPENIPEYMMCGEMRLGRCYAADVIDMDPYETPMGFKGPVLIVHGTCDRVVDISYSRRAKNLYHNAELVEIEGAKHGFNEEQDAAAMASVWPFLQGK